MDLTFSLVNRMDLTFSLVIARFRESLEDVKDLIQLFHKLKPKVYIYNKDDISSIKYEDLGFEDLEIIIEDIPNVGRDAQSFLYHIYKYKNCNTDIIYFIPASYKTKLSYPETCAPGCIFKTLDNFHLLKSEVSKIWNQWYGWSINSWGGTHPENIKATQTQKFEISKIRPLGKWMDERVFNLLENRPFLEPLKNGLCCFIQTTKERINNIPSFIFKIWLDELTKDGPNSELVHYWERSWGTILGSFIDRLPIKNYQKIIPLNIDIYLKCVDYPVLNICVFNPILKVDGNINYFQIIESLNNKEKCISIKVDENRFICSSYLNNTLVIKDFVEDDNFKNEATFRIYQGLGEKGYSFESYIKPNYFIRHKNYFVTLHKLEDSTDYYNGCSFEIIEN